MISPTPNRFWKQSSADGASQGALANLKTGARRSRAAAIAAILLCAGSAAVSQISIPWRQTVWEEDFAESGWTEKRSLYHIGRNTAHDPAAGDLVLTRPSPSQAGRIFLLRPLLIDYFEIRFNAFLGVRSTENRGGADGIVFALGRRFDYDDAEGGKLDFEGCLGYGVELDTYSNSENNDPSGEHLALIDTRASDHLDYTILAEGALKDGAWHDVRITGENGVFHVFLDNVERLSHSLPGFASFLGYAGFTSATGVSYNEHRIDNIRLNAPHRGGNDLGLHSACDTLRLDRLISIGNNHPSGASLSLISASLRELGGSGEFTMPLNPVPAPVPYGGSLNIPVRFSGTGEGLRRAVLTVEASNGESILDTLTVDLAFPRLRWPDGVATFGPTHVGQWSERSLFLRNTGRVTAEIERCDISDDAFSLLTPAVFPVSVAPGDSVEFVVRFTPDSAGVFSAILSVATCAGGIETALEGAAFVSVLEAAFFTPPLMLNPGGSGTLRAVLLDPPEELPELLRGMEAVLVYDPSVASFLGMSVDGGIWSDADIASASEVSPGRIAVSIRRADRISSATDLLFTLRFESARGDTGCSSVYWDELIWNPETSPGIPAAASVDGRICINPSCRVPDGLLRLRPPRLSAAPNPFNPAVTVTWELMQDEWASVRIFDALGITVALLAEGPHLRGTHRAVFRADAFASGTFFVILQTASHRRTLPLLLLK